MMKAPVAVGVGIIAGVTIPYALPESAGKLGLIVQRGSRTFAFAGHDVRFSLTIFLIVAALAWALMVWSDK